MSRKLTALLLAMLVLAGAMSLKAVVAAHSDGGILAINGSAPPPPNPPVLNGSAPPPPNPPVLNGSAPPPPNPPVSF